MNIFDFLTEEAHCVGKKFNNVVDRFPPRSDWSWDRTLTETKKDIEMLMEHLKKETMVENNVDDWEDMGNAFGKAAEQRLQIDRSIDNILDIHVDEAGFKEQLIKIARKLDEHVAFCTDSYYPMLREHLSPDKVQKIEDQLEFAWHV